MRQLDHVTTSPEGGAPACGGRRAAVVVTVLLEGGSPACFGRRSAVVVTVLLAATDPFFVCLIRFTCVCCLMSFPIFSRWTRPYFVQDCLYVTCAF